MVRVRDIRSTAGTAGKYDTAYRTLVTELEHRGWLPPEAAAHARGRVKWGAGAVANPVSCSPFPNRT
jgi:hypothetical protein